MWKPAWATTSVGLGANGFKKGIPMSHHASGPNFSSPHGDARLDMTDLYAFPKPGDVDKSILILNVHPSMAVNPMRPTTKEPFAPGALYEFRIDNNGDATADITYSVQFSSHDDGKQTATMRRILGRSGLGAGEEGEVIFKDAPVSTGSEALVRTAGGYHFFAGWRSDPFFFDADGLFNQMQFTGNDFFADKNVCSIVLELPNSALGPNQVGLWARTIDKTAEGWIQADRGGQPMLAVFLSGEERETYLAAEPADDDRFVSTFAHELEHAGRYTRQDAVAEARKLLPDILSFDPRRPTSFPHTGRTLTDDVVGEFLSVLTNGRVTDGKVGPHSDLLDRFPYVGPPHD